MGYCIMQILKLALLEGASDEEARREVFRKRKIHVHPAVVRGAHREVDRIRARDELNRRSKQKGN